MLNEINDREELKGQVLGELGLRHPILCDTYDLCELNNGKDLLNFNVKRIKEICHHFEIPIKSRDSKNVLLQKLTEELNKCQCHLSDQ